MAPRLLFQSEDGTTAPGFRLTAGPRGYRLPRLVVISSTPVSVVSSAIVGCTAEPGQPALERAVTGLWGPSGPSGYNRTLRSEAVDIPAAEVPYGATVTVRWRVRCLPGELYERYLNSPEQVDLEESVVLRFEASDPLPDPVGTRAHRGHIAVDFGTSNTTVTLFDPKYFPRLPLSLEQLARLRAEVVALIDTADGFPAGVVDEWQRIVAEVSRSLLPGDGTDDDRRRRLVREAAKDEPDRPRFIYALLLELEGRLPGCGEALRAVLGPAMDRAYAQAWRVPPLDVLRLFPVDLDRARGPIVDSAAAVVGRDPLRVRLGAASRRAAAGDDEPDNPGGTPIYAGLKQMLADPRDFPELGSARNSDDVIRESLRFLVEQTNAFVETGTVDLGAGTVDNAVVTYPTMATPPVRRKLRGLLTDIGVKLVNTDYDEAIAAAMFFVMRDFGGDHDLGLEVLRTRSRPVGDRAWEQNVLVIDVGGGTTDIALLTLGLRDLTPEEIRKAPAAGRYYELRPEVRGSTGRLQLGGELATLRVYYWLKAIIADVLLAEDPDRFGPQRQLLEQLDETRRGGAHDGGTFVERVGRGLPRYTDAEHSSGPTSVYDILDAVVPTRSPAGGRQHTEAFWQLWNLAERVKLEFLDDRRPPGVTLPQSRLRGVLAALRWPDGTAGIQLGRDKLDIELTAADFEALATGDVDDVVGLAYALVQARLGTVGGEPAPLHRIILTGQASRSWLVRQRLVHRFGALPGWKPSSIVVEQDFGKQATSLGAAWALATQQLVVASPDGAAPTLRKGRNMLRIDVDNLFFNLPCGFRFGEQLGSGGDNTSELFAVGDELYPLGGSGPDADVAVTRSGDLPLRGIMAVVRETFAQDGPLPSWGDFQWRREAAGLDEAVWRNEMRCRIEVTADLQLFILLWRGRQPHFELPLQPFLPVLPAAVAAGAGAGAGAPVLVRPTALRVNSYAGDGRHEGQPVFSSDEFPETFHIDGRAVRGAAAPFTAAPNGGGAWAFQYADEHGGGYDIGELPALHARDDRPVRRWITLTEDGELRVHAGSLPFWSAPTMLDAEREPGRVHRAAMEISEREYNPARDPFNGRH